MNLFQSGEFTLASGSKSYFKIEMDALKAEDWKTLAKMAVEHLLPPFAEVHGVPTGGQRFAEALEPYAKSNGPGRHRLICDDVLTSGGSMEKFRDSLPKGSPLTDWGLVVFARGKCPWWVAPMFQVGWTK